MTDIPLHLIGRNTRSKEGYTKLQDGDTEELTSSAGTNGHVRANGGANVEMRRSYKGKAPIRTPVANYKDDPDEQDRLLDEHERESSEVIDFQRPASTSRAVRITVSLV